MSAQSGRIVALVSLALIVPAALTLSGACQLPGSKAAPPTADELAELEVALSRADALLELARLGCLVLPELQDRDVCSSTLATMDRSLDVGRSIVATAKTCQAAGDEVCRLEHLRQAREILPEILDLVWQLRAGGAPRVALSGSAELPPLPPPSARPLALPVIGESP